MVRRLASPLMVALLIGTLIGIWANAPSGKTATAAASPAYTINDPGVFIYVPSNAAQFQPVQVLVAMHGMGGNGQSFCQSLLAAAERNGWIIVAPTFKYQDYKNPDLVLQDDTSFLPGLTDTIDSLPARTGLATRQKVLLYGYSRGGQAVHRFATYYPERVLGVAAISAGSYTLPLNTMLVDGRSRTLPMPYGVADMNKYLDHPFNYEAFKRVRFWIEVGGQDTKASDTPRAWDPYLGQTRLDRARAYTRTLQDIGVDASLAVYPDTGHGISPQMQDEALGYLQGVIAKNAAQYGHGPARAVTSYGTLIAHVAERRR